MSPARRDAAARHRRAENGEVLIAPFGRNVRAERDACVPIGPVVGSTQPLGGCSLPGSNGSRP